ncbi:restriction endonuclease subunit S [Lactococcus petauri]|nr:restriction endonuclease subunit S [Lactococcus petauri]
MSKKSPQLRFEGFTDDWEERKFSNLAEVRRGLTYKPSDVQKYGIRVLRSSNIAEDTFLIKSDDVFVNKEAVKIDKVKNGDILITSANGSSRLVGKHALIEGIENDTVHGGFMLVARAEKPEFVNAIMSSSWYSKFINIFVSGGNGAIGNLSKSNLEDQKVYVPSEIEQTKIGLFFKGLDDTIALHQRKIDLLKEQKKGYLQKMFPKNGAKVPELRFAGFTDDWEERKLGEFSDVRDGTHASPKYVSQGHPMVTSKNLTHSGLDMTDVSFLTDEDFNEINKRSKVSIGDILFGMIGTIGNPVIVDRDDFAIKNVALIKEKTSNPITNKWLLQYLKSPSFNRFIQKENAGGTQKFIALGLIRDMKLRVPEFDEQQKIGAFFKKIDETITLHQRKLDLLKEQKKGFLQKMFV